MTDNLLLRCAEITWLQREQCHRLDLDALLKRQSLELSQTTLIEALKY